MSRKNIFEVLQSIAEDSEFNERFLAILREYGYEGTLEEAEETLKQQTQVILNNLTMEDLQNVAGGRFLMNGKLKKALAVGGASLMAGGVVLPHGSALTGQSAIATPKATNLGKKLYEYAKNNPIHSGLTVTLGLATMLLILGEQTKSGLPFADELGSFLWQMDLSDGKSAYHFVNNLSKDDTEITLKKNNQQENSVQLSIKKIAEIKEEEKNAEKIIIAEPDEYTSYTLLLALIKLMDNEKTTYVDVQGYLTKQGALVLNHLAKYIIDKVNQAIIDHDQNVIDAKNALKEYEINLENAKKDKEKLEKYQAFVKKIQNHITKVVKKVSKLRDPDTKNERTSYMNSYKKQQNGYSKAKNKFIKFRQDLDLTSDKNVNNDVLDEIAKTLLTELEAISNLNDDEPIQKNVDKIDQKIEDKFGKLIKNYEKKSQDLENITNAHQEDERNYKNRKNELENAIRNAEEQTKKKCLEYPRKKFGTYTNVTKRETNLGS